MTRPHPLRGSPNGGGAPRARGGAQRPCLIVLSLSGARQCTTHALDATAEPPTSASAAPCPASSPRRASSGGALRVDVARFRVAPASLMPDRGNNGWDHQPPKPGVKGRLT